MNLMIWMDMQTNKQMYSGYCFPCNIFFIQTPPCGYGNLPITSFWLKWPIHIYEFINDDI